MYSPKEEKRTPWNLPERSSHQTHSYEPKLMGRGLWTSNSNNFPSVSLVNDFDWILGSRVCTTINTFLQRNSIILIPFSIISEIIIQLILQFLSKISTHALHMSSIDLTGLTT